MPGRIVREGHTCKGKPELTQHDLGTIWQCDCGRHWRLSKAGSTPSWRQMSASEVAFNGLASGSVKRPSGVRPAEQQLERYCEVMHDAYERAAPGAGWETNPASRKTWADVPESNKATMRAAVAALLTAIRADGDS